MGEQGGRVAFSAGRPGAQARDMRAPAPSPCSHVCNFRYRPFIGSFGGIPRHVLHPLGYWALHSCNGGRGGACVGPAETDLVWCAVWPELVGAM